MGPKLSPRPLPNPRLRGASTSTTSFIIKFKSSYILSPLTPAPKPFLASFITIPFIITSLIIT
ncbi:MAG: hypothetical protein QXG08_03555 [Candidatus Methanomethyliaceae archaeon]